MGSLHKTSLLTLAIVFLSFVGSSQTGHDILQKRWEAYWIAAPGEPALDYGVYRFRKQWTIPAKPEHFTVHVSADNRYKLYVNGTLVSLGPARSDFFHWNFETVDLAPALRQGTNTITAIVWNDGAFRPMPQMSLRTGFILQGDSAVNTNKSWQVTRDSAYAPLPVQLVYSYYVAGPGERVDYNKAEPQWMTGSFNAAAWPAAQEMLHGVPKGVFDLSEGWMLVPRPLPPLELKEQRLAAVRKTEGLKVPAGYPQQPARVTVPANTTATLLFDQGHLTNAFPTLKFSKGKGATVEMGYAEALYIDEGNEKDWRAQNKKGNRNEVEGKRFVGRTDLIVADGGDDQVFTSLSWRTFRYLKLTVQTKSEALAIEDIYSTFVGYPFEQAARFSASNDTLASILEVGWRTARLCAIETYMDCPYYEQLQYVGDTRIQALVSLYNSGDDRLVRNAINQIDYSRMAEGLTLSRFPTAAPQEITPFSLWWIGMLHDWWRYRPDAAFVKSKLPGVRQVLQFFSRYQQADGSLVNSPYWNFTDWANGKGSVNGWDRGVAPMGKDGVSAALDLQLLWAYQLAAELEAALGMKAFAATYQLAATLLKQTVQKKYWNAATGLFADTPEKESYSQHVNALAILTGTTTGAAATTLARKMLTDTSLTQATVYFKYYTHQAFVKAGLGNSYLDWLDVWKQNLKMGLTTWAEISDLNATRSDCHAWGAHPNIEFFRTVLGIDSDAPGFTVVKVEPHLGALKKVSGQMPHPNGTINASYELARGRWKCSIQLPRNTNGYLVWKRKKYSLKRGETTTLALP